MGIKGLIARAIEKATDTRILRELPRGFDVFNDIKTDLPGFQINTMFDIGANIGQTAEYYAKTFPNATIYCFEPVSVTFEQLRENTKTFPNVRCVKLALSAHNGEAKMVVQGTSTLNRIINDTATSASVSSKSVETVELKTLDSFCETEKIERINYLKIDAEGSDFDVILGATGIFSAQRADLVELEAGMNPNNRLHVPFEKLKSFMESYRYYLFAFYEQVDEWPTKEPNLRRTNPVFISEQLIKKFRRG